MSEFLLNKGFLNKFVAENKLETQIGSVRFGSDSDRIWAQKCRIGSDLSFKKVGSDRIQTMYPKIIRFF
jgi:hypothetical protein